MIDHHEISCFETLSRVVIETTRVAATRLFRTDVRLATDLCPYFRIRLDRQIAQRTVARRARPFGQTFQLILLRSGEKLTGLL